VGQETLKIKEIE